MNNLDQFKFDPDKCVICFGDNNEKLVTPRPNGLQTILDSCARRADTRLMEYRAPTCPDFPDFFETS